MKVAMKRGSVFGVSRAAFVVCALVSLCACGSGQTTQPKEPKPPPPGPKADDSVADPTPVTDAGTVLASIDPKPDDPPPPAEDPVIEVKLDLVDTVATTKSRADMSAFLVKPAKAAVAKNDHASAIVYYSALAVARGPASPEARTLADEWALAGQNEQAVRILETYIAASTDPDQIQEARTAAKRIGSVNDPFKKDLKLPALKKDADKVFKLGRKAFKKKKWGDALVYYHMGAALAPDLPGFLRELGSTYDKLKQPDKKLDFYRAYLFKHPFGKNADEIRKSVKKEKGVLGKLTLTSTLTCEVVLIQGSGEPQVLPGNKLPAKKLALAPGTYGVLCFSGEYGLYYRDPVTITADTETTHEFKWAVIENALTSPLGRISIENTATGKMSDLGIDTAAHGVVCPDDGHSLRLLLTDDSGTKSEERYLKLEPGQRYVIKW
jgi:hypothetical protein